MPKTLEVTSQTKAVLKAIKTATSKDVLVGIPGGATRSDDGINNALLGYVLATGDPARNLPARPFLGPGIRSVADPIKAQMKKALLSAIAGDSSGLEAARNSMGLIAASGIKKAITDGPFEPLAPRTLAARRARGRTGDKPLLDTGALRNAVTYVIRKAK